MRHSRFAVMAATAVLVLLTAVPSGAAISLSTTTPYVERFDGMGSTATATVPTDFKVDKPTVVRTVGTYAAATTVTNAAGGANLSGSAANGIYNFGSGTTTTGTDRAVGFLSSGTATSSGNLYAAFVNSTGGNVSGLTISYDVEKYRTGINANGFRYQLFYSMDGTAWTSAGGDFLTFFAGDSGVNSGFATAPGVTTSVNGKTLNVSIPSGGQIYLAWNYSVAAGTTTTNAQALAIDNVSVLAIGGGTPGTTSPTGSGAASPASVQTGGSSQLTVSVTPGANPASTGLIVRGDLSSIGGSLSQTFANAGGNNFAFTATIAPGTSAGAKTLPVTITDAEGRSGSAVINLSVVQPPPPTNHIVISQVYGGGGNSGATYNRDFIELYNPGTITIDVTGWSVQYSSAAGTSSSVQPLTGPINPGEYYLVALATGAEGGPLPEANVSGDLNLSGTTGKVALVNTTTALVGGCPVSDVSVVDYVGYGTTATCREGAANAPAPSNSTAIVRKSGGALDTNENLNDFATGLPTPRRTAVITEVGPRVVSADPQTGLQGVPRDASITLTFSEPVTVVGSWFSITCAITGAHNDATQAGASKVWAATPNVNFVAGEQCTATIFKDAVHDVDLDDATPGTDTMSADFTWTFTISTGTAPPFPSDVHLTMGNPTNAITSQATPNNYLMVKPEFALSYNRDKGWPNWVSWHLSDDWTGGLARIDTFRPDPEVPSDWYRVQAFDFQNSGFDRGHMTPNADRNKVTSAPINQATFLMSNMLAQAPGNNQGPWGNFESYLRTLFPANELYVVSGPSGVGGTGDSGFATTIANGHVTVPAQTWKVALVLPKLDGNDISRVSAATRTIAVIMPNITSIRANSYETYYTTVDAVENLTGYNFFSNLPLAVQNSIEAGLNGANPPGTADQAIGVTEDVARTFTLDVASNGNVTTTILTPVAHGALQASGSSVTYTPAPDYFGDDSFTYRVSDGTRSSNTSTVTLTVLEVNDPASATDDMKTTSEDAPLSFAASELTTNDSAGPANESGQSLTVTSVASTADTHGSVALAGGQVSYSPEANYNGAAAFTYQVCDNGVTGGVSRPSCTTATVHVTVTEVNDPPTATDDSRNATEDTTLSFAASELTTNDSGGPSNESGQTLTVTSVTATADTHGTIALNAGQVTYTPAPNYDGPANFTYQVCDNGLSVGLTSAQCATATVQLTVAAVNDPATATDDSKTTAEDTTLTFAASELTTNDSAGPANESGQTLTVTSVTATAATHGNATLANGQVTYTPAPNYNGPASFTYQVCDNGITNSMTSPQCASATVHVTVSPVNDAPSASISVTNTASEGSSVTATATASDVDAGDSLTYAWTVTAASGPVATGSGNTFTFTPQDNGAYSVSVVVADTAGATGSDAKTVNVGNVAPVITSVSGPTAPVQAGSSASININYTDAGAGDTHTALVTWDDGTSSIATCSAGVCTAPHTFTGAGVYGVSITLTDDDGGSASASFTYVIVVDPAAGFVTAAGWYDSAAGKTTFELEAKYDKTNTPAGKLNLQVQKGDRFTSTAIDWLVISGANAQVGGTGTINNKGSYGFIATMIDGDAASPRAADRFRVRIWDRTTGVTVYDNVTGASDDIDAANPQEIGGGNVTLHK